MKRAPATPDCGGRQVIFTICGETVFAELPGVFVGAFEGRFTGKTDTKCIYEESLTLYECAHSYHLSPLSPMPEDSADEGGDLAQEHAEAAWGAPDGVPGFMPKQWVRAINPTSLLEKRPATLIFGNFQYTDDGNWLDVTGPLYRRQFAGMRNLRIEEGVAGEDAGYEMEITFRCGERTVVCFLADVATGTEVSIFIY